MNASLFFQSSNSFCTKPSIPPTLTMTNCSKLTCHDFADYEACHSSERIIYEEFDFESTVVTDYNLVCDDQYKVTLASTVYMLGLCIGAFAGGPPADKYGRKPVLFIFIFLGGFGNLLAAVFDSYPAFVIFRLISGIGEQGLTQVSCALSVELVGPRYQNIIGNVNQAFFSVGTGIVSSPRLSAAF